VQRPLLEPDDNARLSIADQQRHIATLKALAHEMRSTNDRILGCPIPVLGNFLINLIMLLCSNVGYLLGNQRFFEVLRFDLK